MIAHSFDVDNDKKALLSYVFQSESIAEINEGEDFV